MKPQSYKRLTAYVIDIFIVTIIASLLTFNISYGNNYKKQMDDYVSLINDYTNQEILDKEFKLKTNDLIYEMNKDTLVITIVNVAITTIYFVVVPYFMNGQTLGKKLMKLQIISKNNKEITMNQYLIRSLFINSILMNLLGIIFILFMSKEMYIKSNDIITYIFGIFYVVSIALILFREDGRGLHDLLGNTMVIQLENTLDIVTNKEKEEKENKIEKIKDAEIIGKELKM